MNIIEFLKQKDSKVDHSSDADVVAADELEKLKRNRYKWDTKLKFFQAIFIAIFISAWSFGVFRLLWKEFKTSGESLPTEIYITLLATTLIEVFGLQYLVIKHFFPEESKKQP